MYVMLSFERKLYVISPSGVVAVAESNDTDVTGMRVGAALVVTFCGEELVPPEVTMQE
jgi:hypothetical protein